MDGSSTNLTAKINQEILDRKSEDNILKELIDGERTARENKDTELADAIATLKTDYEKFKSDTSVDLNAKKLQIDTLTEDIENVKTVQNAQSTQMSSMNATITAMQTVLATMETSLENMKKTISEFQVSIGTANQAKEIATAAAVNLVLNDILFSFV